MARGGFRPGAGRPKGSTAKITDSSIKKLNELGIDPIDMLVKELKSLKGKDDFRSRALRVRITEKLLEYGYSRRPVSVDHTNTTNIPVLTVVNKVTNSEPKEVTPIVDVIPNEETKED